MKPFKRVVDGKETKVYYVRFQINGKRILKSTKKTVKSEAEEWIKKNIIPLINQDNAKGLAQTVKQMSVNAEKIKLSDAFNAFLKVPKRRPIGEQQQKLKKSVWDDFTAYINDSHPGVNYIHQLDYRMCAEYITYLRENGRFNKSTSYKRGNKTLKTSNKPRTKLLSPKSCNEYLNTLKQICSALLISNDLTENPFAAIPPMEIQKETREPFTREELQLISQKADSFLFPIFAIGLSTGLRKGDICTLKWSEIDLENGWINRVMLKTKKTVRIPIMQTFHNYLQTLPRDSEYVIPEQADMYLNNPHGISYRVKKLLEELDIKTTKSIEGRSTNISIKDIHSLRHNFVWDAAEHGVPLPIIQSVVGHMTPKMTRIYADHATDKAKKEQLQIPNYLGLPEAQNNNSEQSKLTAIQAVLDSDKTALDKLNKIAQLAR